MEIYFILLILLIIITISVIYWGFKIFQFFHRKQFGKAAINTSILAILILLFCWELQIIPLAAESDFRQLTTNLTGKEFRSKKEYKHEDISVRGEGYLINMYKFDSETAKYFNRPDKTFFTRPFKPHSDTTWKETPIIDVDEIAKLEFLTPIYGNWDANKKEEIRVKQELIKEIASEPNSFYTFKTNNERSIDFYLISADHKLFIHLNHDM